jgi:hypothetical protein
VAAALLLVLAGLSIGGTAADTAGTAADTTGAAADTIGAAADTAATVADTEAPLRGVLLPVAEVTSDILAHYATHGVNAVVLDLAEVDHPDFALALTRIRLADHEIYYWVEIGHDREAARDHPDWLHRPHKVQFYDEPVVIDEWVCINNRAVFDYKLAQVTDLAVRAGVEGVRGILLNDVLGAPEGCGCGNALCRLWDGSVGEKISGGEGVMSFGANPVAPRLFAEEVSRRLGGLEAIPIITEECEGGIEVCGVTDPERTLGYGRMSCRNPCAVDSYRRLIEQLSPLPRVGLLTLYQTFGRNVPEYGPEAAWIGCVIERYHGHDPSQTVIAILEGWDVTAEQVEAQVTQAVAGGAGGFVIVKPPIDQTWRVKPAQAKGKRI